MGRPEPRGPSLQTRPCAAGMGPLYKRPVLAATGRAMSPAFMSVSSTLRRTVRTTGMTGTSDPEGGKHGTQRVYLVVETRGRRQPKPSLAPASGRRLTAPRSPPARSQRSIRTSNTKCKVNSDKTAYVEFWYVIVCPTSGVVSGKQSL